MMSISDLYEELIHLDEIAGELDAESNALINVRRIELKAMIDAGETRRLQSSYEEARGRGYALEQ